MKLSDILKIYDQEYDYHLDFLVLSQGKDKGNLTMSYCTEAYMRDLYVIEYLLNHFDLYSIFADEKDDFILQDAIGSANIEKAKITDLKLMLYKMRLNISKGNKMLKNIHSLYKSEPINAVEGNIIDVWNKIIKNCCGNSSIRGVKYRNGDVIVGGFRPIHYTEIQDTYPNVVKELIDIKSPILRGILLHYVTAYYHPFCDGNGRLSRYLMRNEFAKMCKGLELLPLSYYLYKDVNSYYSLFPKVVNSLTPDCFISYFCQLIKYTLIYKLIEKGKIVIDEEYFMLIDFLNQRKRIGVSDCEYIEEYYNISNIGIKLEDLRKIGYVFKNSIYYYKIGG